MNFNNNMADILQPATTNSDQQLVDRVVYLCSLAADPIAINPMTDRLRAVTARWKPSQSMAPEDRKTLAQLERDLKVYLTQHDPLRSFTMESLEERLQGQGQSNQNIVSLCVVLGSSVLAAAAPFALPVDTLTPTFRALLSVPLFFLVLHIGIAWFYFSALQNFNKDFRSAFTYICIGLLLLSVGFSHYVMLQLFGWQDQPAFKYGGITLLISICFIFMYAGLRIYARLLQLKTWLSSLTLVLSITLGLVIVAALVPHGGPVENEAYFDFSLACAAFLPLYAILSAGLAHKIIKNVTPAYSRSMKWLYRYLLLVGVGSIGGTLALAVVGELNGGALYTVIALCGIAPQLLLLYTGYSFKKETSR